MRRQTPKQAAAARDKQIEQAFYRHATGVQINIMDLGKIHAAGRAAIETGRDLDAAIVAAVAEYRQN